MQPKVQFNIGIGQKLEVGFRSNKFTKLQTIYLVWVYYCPYQINLKGGIVMPKKGEKMSEEHKRKIAEAHKGKPKIWSEEARENIRKLKSGKPIPKATEAATIANTGRKHTEETKRKLSAILKGKGSGRKLSEEHRKAISEANKRRYQNTEERLKTSMAGKLRYQNPDELHKTRQQLDRVRNDPIAQAKRAKTVASPEYKAKRSELVKQYMSRPDVKARMSKIVSEANKRNWADSEFRKKRLTLEYTNMLSDKAKQQWQNPEFRGMMIIKARERFINMWNDPIKHEKMARKVVENGSTFNFEVGIHDSPKAGQVRYRSSYELAVYKQLDDVDDVKTYQAEPFSIPYEFDGTVRSYFPDLLITYIDDIQLVVEVKPTYALDDPQNQAKFQAAQAIYGDRFEIWSEEVIFNELQ